jgi:predicted  nucleic acid-binding Zn-ribbon protein
VSTSLGLFRLQQVDSRIGQVEARLARVGEMLGNDVELQEALEGVKSADGVWHEAERIRRTSEEEARSQQIKIQQAESSLYGGQVQNPKELQDLQADIVSLKRHLGALEERELEAMLRSEEAQTSLGQAQEKLRKLQARLGDEHRELITEREALGRDLQSLQVEREAAVSAVAAEMLSIYENLRRERRGVAVAEVSEDACGACGTTLTAALQQSARHTTQLVRCPSCGRILYAG